MWNLEKIAKIKKTACEKFNINKNQLTSSQQSQDVVRARDWASMRLHELGLSSNHIGRPLNKDHSTILTAIKRQKKREKKDGKNQICEI